MPGKSANLVSGTLFRSVAKTGKVWGSGFTAKVIYSIVRKAASDCGFGPVAPEELRVTLATAAPFRPSHKQVSVSLNLSMEGGSLVAGSA